MVPSAEPEAEPVFHQHSSSLHRFPSYILFNGGAGIEYTCVHQQKLSRNIVKTLRTSICFNKYIIEALAYKSAYLVDTKRCRFCTLRSAFEAGIGCWTLSLYTNIMNSWCHQELMSREGGKGA